jgi:hypothetical protein
LGIEQPLSFACLSLDLLQDASFGDPLRCGRTVYWLVNIPVVFVASLSVLSAHAQKVCASSSFFIRGESNAAPSA